MKIWIMSWFKILESEKEFFISLKEFKEYFKSVEEIIGSASGYGIT